MQQALRAKAVEIEKAGAHANSLRIKCKFYLRQINWANKHTKKEYLLFLLHTANLAVCRGFLEL